MESKLLQFLIFLNIHRIICIHRGQDGIDRNQTVSSGDENLDVSGGDDNQIHRAPSDIDSQVRNLDSVYIEDEIS